MQIRLRIGVLNLLVLVALSLSGSESLIDSLRTVIANEADDSTRIERRLDLVFWLVQSGDTAAYDEIDEAINEALEFGAFPQAVIGFQQESEYHLQRGNYGAAKKSAQEGFRLAKEHDLEKEPVSYTHLTLPTTSRV